MWEIGFLNQSGPLWRENNKTSKTLTKPASVNWKQLIIDHSNHFFTLAIIILRIPNAVYLQSRRPFARKRKAKCSEETTTTVLSRP
jgi:hypothetical protein